MGIDLTISVDSEDAAGDRSRIPDDMGFEFGAADLPNRQRAMPDGKIVATRGRSRARDAAAHARPTLGTLPRANGTRYP